MHLKTLVSITLLSTILQITTQSPIITHPQKHNNTLQKQISTTLKFFDYPRCTTSNLTTQLECSYLSTLPKQNITVYYATSSSPQQPRPPQNTLPHGDAKLPRTKVTAIFLEHSGNPPPTNPSSSPHDAIIVLDPYPNKSFGHLLAVFYIDYNVPDFHDCKEPYQIYTIDKTCVTLATKPKCPNKLDKYYYYGGSSIEKRCQIDFLPTVFSTLEFNYLKDDGYYGDGGMMPRANLLACVELKEFSSCPKLRGLDDTNRVVCGDGAVGNSKRCDTSHTGVGTRCKLFQTCDRAILLSGGWNRLHSGYKYYDNIVKVQDTLSSLGFLRDNVKTFFGNGKVVGELSNAQGDDAIHRYEASSFFSSAMKTGLRGHVRTVCENPYCSDTVFIYLNSHVLGGGSGGMVLWDFDYDGVINTELESYTVKEFVSDIRNCEANRVVVVADQAYSGSLVSAINGSVEHRNVVLVVPRVEEPVFGVVTDAFVEGVRGGGSGCFKRGDTQDAYVVVDNSGSGTSSVSLTGAPCGLLFGGTRDFVKKRYEGCQNVPISVWFSITSTTANDDDDDDDDRDSGEEPGGGVRSQDSSSGDDKSPNWRRLLQ